MILTLIVFIASLGALVFSADKLLHSLEQIGHRLNISDAILAFFLVAIGTSLPEMVASLFAAQDGETDLAIANLFGSNLTNSLLIGGLLVAFGATATRGTGIAMKRNLMLLASLVAILAVWFLPVWLAACALMLSAALVLSILLKSEQTVAVTETRETEQGNALPVYAKAALWLALLVTSGLFTVKSVESLGALLGLSATLVGLVFLAFGTSLPELVTSWIAIRKGKANMAFATLLGSNVINVTLVLSLTLFASTGWKGMGTGGLTLSILAAIATVVLGVSLRVSPRARMPLAMFSFILYAASIWAVS